MRRGDCARETCVFCVVRTIVTGSPPWVKFRLAHAFGLIGKGGAASRFTGAGRGE